MDKYRHRVVKNILGVVVARGHMLQQRRCCELGQGYFFPESECVCSFPQKLNGRRAAVQSVVASCRPDLHQQFVACLPSRASIELIQRASGGKNHSLSCQPRKPQRTRFFLVVQISPFREQKNEENKGRTPLFIYILLAKNSHRPGYPILWGEDYNLYRYGSQFSPTVGVKEATRTPRTNGVACSF